MRLLLAAVVAPAAQLSAQAPGSAPTPPRAPTASQVLTGMSSRAALLEDIERSRQNVLKYLEAAPDSMLGFRLVHWRWVGTALEHATWTLGQTVPYLRAHGVTPPQYLAF